MIWNILLPNYGYILLIDSRYPNINQDVGNNKNLKLFQQNYIKE